MNLRVNHTYPLGQNYIVMYTPKTSVYKTSRNIRGLIHFYDSLFNEIKRTK